MPRRGVDEWFWSVGDLQRMTGEMVSSRPVVASGKCWEPRIDLIEDEHRFLVKAEIAGVRGEDIQLVYLPERNSIVIRGIRQDEDAPHVHGRRLHQLEIPTGEFSREIKLPEMPLHVEGMRAQYKNGFLFVMIPKVETVVVTESITITGL